MLLSSGGSNISSGTAALLVATAPIFTTILSIYYKQIYFRWYVAAGLLLSVTGAALIVSNQLDGEDFGILSPVLRDRCSPLQKADEPVIPVRV